MVQACNTFLGGKHLMKLILSLFLSLGLTVVCSAKPATFIYSGIASGRVGAQDFTNTAYVITGVADTDNVSFDGFDVYSVDHTSTAVELAGIGTYTLLSPTRTFAASNAIVGLSRAYPSGLDLIGGPISSAFAGWQMKTSIGPVTGFGTILQWANGDINTDSGVLFFENHNSGTHTFQAIVTPEPSSICLCIGSIVLLGIRRRG